jgi:hypothetical protein
MMLLRESLQVFFEVKKVSWRIGVSNQHHLVFHNLLMRNAGTQKREALEMAP